MATGGLTALGQALAGGARDYANIRLSREAEERQRAARLADQMSQRAYADEVYGRQRSDALADEQRLRRLALEDEERRRTQRVDDATIEILVKSGYLAPADVRDPDAVALANRQYEVDQAREQGRRRDLPERLQTEADLLAQRDAELAQAEASLSAKLSAPEPAPPSETEVLNLARRLTGKETPSASEIEANIPAAQEQIASQRLQRWYMDQQDAKAQIPLLRAQRQDLSRQLTFMFQQGVTPNRTPPPPTPNDMTQAPRALGDPMGNFVERLNGAGSPAPAPAQAPVSQYQYPAASILGLGERAFGGNDFSAQRFAEAPANILAFPGRAIDSVGRYGGAALRGAFTGDYSVPKEGLVTQAGNALGRMFAPEILPGDYMSAKRAQALNLPRSPDNRNPGVVFQAP